jgi:hypothetical protein
MGLIFEMARVKKGVSKNLLLEKEFPKYFPLTTWRIRQSVSEN